MIEFTNREALVVSSGGGFQGILSGQGRDESSLFKEKILFLFTSCRNF
ncbi:hypothetical protein L6386_03800 [bacterium]|nr:hypothetical protein [bacterium]MCG2675802.1 hypothetical protein [bacterium]MCG2677663.1 hypothetical protein [bacterium]